MATIGFILDPDPGHIYPTLGIAKELQAQGNEIHLFGIADIENLLKCSSHYLI